MALIKKQNIVAVQGTYKTKEGQEKNFTRQIGELLTFSNENGGEFQAMNLFHMPGVKISIYDQKEKEKTIEDKMPWE